MVPLVVEMNPTGLPKLFQGSTASNQLNYCSVYIHTFVQTICFEKLLVTTRHDEGVLTCYQGRMIPTSLPEPLEATTTLKTPIGVKFCIESVFEVEKCKILGPVRRLRKALFF